MRKNNFRRNIIKKIRLEKFHNLVNALNQLPTVGKKSALKFAYHLVLEDTYLAMKLAHSIENAVAHVNKCTICGNIAEDEICYICEDESRDKTKLCIIDSVKDIMTLEENTEYKGIYFVLKKLEDDAEKLKSIIEADGVKEIIFALSPSIANEAVILFVEDRLQKSELLFTKIAQGVPTGVNLENVDMLSLSKAIEARVSI